MKNIWESPNQHCGVLVESDRSPHAIRASRKEDQLIGKMTKNINTPALKEWFL